MLARQDNNIPINSIQSNEADLLSLPPEMLAEILSHLPVSSIIRLAMISKQFNKRLLSDNTEFLKPLYWQTQLKDYFPDVAKEIKSNYARKFIDNYVNTINEIELADLSHSPAAIKKDRDIVLAAVKKNGWALQYADESLKRDRDIVLVAVKRQGGALQYADESLKRNRDIVLAAIKQNGGALQYADWNLKKDRDLVLAAVMQDGKALKYANMRYWKDRDLVLVAVMQDGAALQYADENLKKDRELVLAAVKQNGLALQYAVSYWNDRDIVLAAVKQNGGALQYADWSLKEDRDIVLAAVKQNGEALQYADWRLKEDRDIVLAAVKQNGLALQYADVGLKKDRKMVLAASMTANWLADFRNLADVWDVEFSEIYSICKEIFTKDTAEQRAEAYKQYASSPYLHYIKPLILQDIENKLRNPQITHAQILELFKQIKDPEGPYKILHQQSNTMWNTVKLRLFQFNNNSHDAKPFWHTDSYQKAVKLLKDAYISCKDDQADQHNQDEANSLIDYTRRNFFGPAKETETRMKLRGGV